MKTFILILTFCGCMASANVFAQTPKAIEADLLNAFKKINYWDEQKNSTGADDSLNKANEVFSKKLADYTVKYPFTINQPFNLLKKEHLDVCTSSDGLFRIYSWDTWLGGSMHIFENVFQYKVGNKTMSVFHPLKWGGEVVSYWFPKVYTLKAKDKTYYLGIYGGIFSTKDAGTGIQVFAIENGRLNEDVKLIKTSTGLHSKLYYDYDFFSIVDIKFELRPTITFDAATQTIRLPLVDGKGKFTSKYITYKFTGQYFEKVKS